ncbi:unnamed protein product [Candida verbasci]|uniref:Actin cytoskeleton-regulatory complex protein SLA1 n=1 Tax=Candida verbasci TaxID=1227364 RepID=A0A9W4XK49_9ASCO|nr:unnamed protein product [Candida verbasci]
MTIKQKVLFLEAPKQEYLKEFEKRFECILYQITSLQQTLLDFRNKFNDIEAIYAGWPGFSPIGGLHGKLINALPTSLKIITTCTVGVDSFDVEALKARNIVLTNVPSQVAFEAVADLVLYDTLASFRNFKFYENHFNKSENLAHCGILRTSLVNGKFDSHSGKAIVKPIMGSSYAYSCCGRSNYSPKNHNVVIVGFGNIGQLIADRLACIGMNIHYVKRKKLTTQEESKLNYKVTFHKSLEETKDIADLIVIACPGSPMTRHLINADLINKMSRPFRIINIGRGLCIDENALVKGLKSGKVLFAGLDVFEQEPEINPGLLDRDDVLLTPHIGSALDENDKLTALTCMEDIDTVLFGYDKPITRIYKAIYDYHAQADEELSINVNDILYLLEKSDIDEWWKLKKRVLPSGDEVVDEPIGLVPSNYIEPAPVLKTATALYDYDKQTEEELSFKEQEKFNIYDLNDPDWILVSDSSNQQFGFVPSNYIQLDDSTQADFPPNPNNNYQPPQPPSQIQFPVNNFQPPPQHISRSEEVAYPPPTPQKDYPRQLEDESPIKHQPEQEDDATPPPMPSRPTGNQNYEQEDNINGDEKEHTYDGDFFTWHIDEVDGRKKRAIKLSIGQGLIIIKPNTSNPKKLKLKSSSTLDNEWKIRDLTKYSHEKKHIFLEFKNPSVSLELHTGTKDVAEAIMAILGDLKGAEQARGLKEVAKASQASTDNKNRKIGRLLYDFKAQGSDELNCMEGDEVYIVNESKSKDWWMVENVDSGRQGVVPATYIEIISTSNLDKLTDGPLRRRSTRSKGGVVDGKERLHRHRTREERDRVREKDRSQRDKQHHDEKSGPNYHRVRTWIDSSGTFKVEAEFLGCVEGKVHLHKTNGVKIAVAAEKLSVEDLEYVEKVTGTSLESYKEQVMKQQAKRSRSRSRSGATASEPELKHQHTSAMAAINDIPPPQPSRPKATTQTSNNGAPLYDWFDFFLQCGVDIGNCQRYTLNFEREQMDENILEDISPSLLRTLGLREGDIIRVMKFLDNKFNRSRSTEPEKPTGGLFIDNNGALKNNSSATAVSKVAAEALPSPIKTQQTISSPPQKKIDDDAWAMKPAARSNENLLKSSLQPQTPQYTGSLSDLVNIKPMETKSDQVPSAPSLQPTKTASAPPPRPSSNQGIPVPAQRTGGFIPIQRTGQGLIQTQTGGTILPAQPTGFVPITAQPTGFVPIQATGLQPQITIGIIPLQPVQTTFNTQQKTGPFQTTFVPLQTGNITMPQTTFGAQNTGGIMPQTSFGTQNTGGYPQTSSNQPPLQPAQRTGGQLTGGFVAQSNFGKQITGGFIPQPTFGQLENGNLMPQTSFGAQNIGGIMPQTSFGQQQITGGFMQQPSFNNTNNFQQPTGGFLPQQSFNQNTGGYPQTSFGQNTGGFPQTSFGQQSQMNQNTGGFPQTSFGQQPQMNQMTNMFQNTSISQPQTTFGQSPQFEGFNQQQSLQSQPTGTGFGNAPLQSQQTGKRANINAATPDNPFGFFN